jgi:outer membrane receptor protein involved in Fe transport
MIRIALMFLTIAISIAICNAQGTVRGKIADENGETLIGVTVYVKNDPGGGVVTDFDGNYTLAVVNAQANILVIEYVGFETIEEPISVTSNEVLIKDFTMVVPSQTINEVVVTAKQERAKAYNMENIKKRSAVTLDYVSAESMKKIGDSNVTAAVTRVAGVSTNGSFITVRGIGDRYVLTAINGSQIPTLDPFTNNIKLDIIPSSLVDNVIISKTVSPDLSGDWTGAYISVETKDFPEKFALNVESQVGFNQNSSFKNILANDKSSTDWLGYDNGLRDRSHDPSIYYQRPTDYNLFLNLGLGDYYKGLGVTSDWENLNNQEAKDNYYKLGLVELGLLPKGLINDREAIKAAEQKFNNEGFRTKAFENLNGKVSDVGKTFANNWKSYKQQSSTNVSQSFSLGNQSNILGKQLGYILGFRYGQTIQYDGQSSANRVRDSELRVDENGELTIPVLDARASPEISRYSNGWSALFNLSAKLSANNNTSFMFMPNFIGTNNLRENLLYDNGPARFQSSQFYEQRKQLIYQAKTEQYFPKSKIKLELNASYTKGNSIVPDFKKYAFLVNEFDTTQYFYNQTELGNDLLFRVYRYLKEDLFDSRISLELPISNNPSLVRKIKIGGAFKNLEKTYDQYNYAVDFGDDNKKRLVPNKDLVSFFDLDNFTPKKDVFNNTVLPYFYANQDLPPNHTQGRTSVSAAYAMTDYSFTNKLRLSGGLRMEHTDLIVDAVAYDTLNLKRNDIRRNYLGALISNPGKLKSLNFLPSVNFIYKLIENELSPTNLRLNYSKTLARPSQREYSESIIYDFELRTDVFGNADLKLVEIDNYDLRFEKYFASGENISASVFYKNFKNHIEVVYLNGGLSWSNTLGSNVQGLEFEGRKKIGKNFEFAANVSFVKSKSTVIDYGLFLDVATGIQTRIPIDTFSRVMFGQSPLVLNTMLSYKMENLGLSASLAYNVQAPRLVIQGGRDVADISKNVPDIYEMERHLVDFKLIKSLTKNFDLSFSIRDLLNSPIRRSYKYVDSSSNNLGYLVDFDKFTYGTNYLLSISYKI